ncbi:DoxX family membrane protein [Dinghuibacter silviterrae]|uniref:DoxX-like protein n=1 Tax=Dinghuibacter silviterrae TaxID=1539049 RepID=A0A4R8DSD8_9BACT|nr:DoxX family membrane protein [Dinghuibacter silviterrae]TDX00297.1 DoxX-like protein [Dinghuibacter silviterrae]
MKIIQLYLRLALGIGFLVPGLDRLGCWGPHGGAQISWGDWAHFQTYAREVMSFLPTGLADKLAVVATAAELTFGVLLVLGLWTRWAALGSGLLLLGFAISMAVSFGIVSPLSYSVFTASAGAFLLSGVKVYPFSLDALLTKRAAPSSRR